MGVNFENRSYVQMQEVICVSQIHDPMPNKSEITAMTAHPDATRGFGGNILLDEHGFHGESTTPKGQKALASKADLLWSATSIQCSAELSTFNMQNTRDGE